MNGIFKVVFYWTLVARHISRRIDKDPHLKPRSLPIVHTKSQSQISLSSTQETQIREIFDLFDTDGGGTIDRKEIDFAMMALGFRSPNQKSQRNAQQDSCSNVLDSITQDGHVTLDEFVMLMTGHEANGRDPMHSVVSAFAVLSRFSSEGTSQDNLITFEKLQKVCRDFEVLLPATHINNTKQSHTRHQRISYLVSILVLDSLRLFVDLLQILLSDDDLKIMVQEASAHGSSGVDLKTFLAIMENSPWF